MEWRTANILFADVKGYSALDDEKMKIFTTCILKKIGTETKHLDIIDRNTWGDGIVLISDRISDACEAAIKIRDIFHGENWGRYNLPKLDIRISVHHGEYLAGVDGFTERATFCGRSVVTAARIEPVTPPGRIWITDIAAMLLKQHIEAEARSGHPPYFAIDNIGNISLPKKYGNIDICCLRRENETPLSATDLENIRDAEKLRLAADADQYGSGSITKIAREESIKSFYIVIGVVIHDGKVLLVKRRDNSEGLSWMFPSGKKWPTRGAEETVEKEVQEETGVVCQDALEIAEVDQHPLTGFRCVYFSLTPSGSTAIVNGDKRENSLVEWVPIGDALLRLGKHLNEDVRKFLENERRRS